MKKAIKDPKLFLIRFLLITKKMWSDEAYIKAFYRVYMGHKLNLNAPRSYSEKCQWLKLYDRKPFYHKMVDKYEVKKVVTDKIGEEYTIPCYGVWDTFDEIDFSVLPNEFILKCTHDSGSFVICRDKKQFDFNAAKKKLERGQNADFYYIYREWVYKDVKPRIMAEKFIPSIGQKDSVEYKLTCFDGEVKVITVCGGIPHQDFSLRSNDNFNKDWTRQDWYAHYKPLGGVIPKPVEMDKMVELSEKLSKGIPQVRVDWYVVEGRIFFGEFTFYTWAGFPIFTPEKWDYILGDWIKLPQPTTE